MSEQWTEIPIGRVLDRLRAYQRILGLVLVLMIEATDLTPTSTHLFASLMFVEWIRRQVVFGQPFIKSIRERIFLGHQDVV